MCGIFCKFTKGVCIMTDMPLILTRVLARAVPDIHINSARVTRWPVEESYFINALPVHLEYWMRFKEIYPHWKQAAVNHNATKLLCPCPEFNTEEDLVSWLIDVLSLTRGVKSLLRLALRR